MKRIVSVVIVSYRSRAALARCLPSLQDCRARVPLEVIVVDNASGDDTVPWIRAAHDWVQVIVSPANEGFGRGVNRGARAAQGDVLLVLNPDCEIAAADLERLLDALDEVPAAAAVAPALVDGAGHVARSVGRFPTLWNLVCDHWGPARWWGGTAWFGGYKYGGRPRTELRDVQWASGAALLVRRAVWERLGGFDPAFFMYMEDVDWCRRAAALGLTVRYVPDAVVVHHGQQSSRLVLHETYAHNLRSRVHYFRKHHGPRAAAAAETILAGSLRAKWLVTALRRGPAAAGLYARGLRGLRGLRPGARAAATGRRAAAVLLLAAAAVLLAQGGGKAGAGASTTRPVRAAYFYSYMGADHLDSLAARAFTRAIVHWNTDSLGRAGAAELRALAQRADALGLELAPEWVFQAAARLATRPAERRYSWGDGVVEPTVPCPLDSLYWQSALVDRAEEFLAVAPGLGRVAVDLELQRVSHPHYTCGPCRCASCLGEYVAAAPALAGRDPARLAGLHAWEEARLAAILRPMLAGFATRHPGVRLEVLDLDLDSFVHRALARALAAAGVPTTDYTERSYSSGAASLPTARARLRALGLGGAPLVGGLWLKRFPPATLAPAVAAMGPYAEGSFVFTTYSLWQDPAKLTSSYQLPGSVADTWAALAAANAQP